MAKSNPENSRRKVGGAVLGAGRHGDGGVAEEPGGFPEEAASILEKRCLSNVHRTYRDIQVWKMRDH